MSALRWLGALVLCSMGCQLVLDIPSDSAKLDASVRITCQCELLLQQGAEFGQLCDEELDSLEVEQLTTAAEQGCTRCSAADLPGCYALITGAKPSAESCASSAECASWACCAAPALDAGLQLDFSAAACSDSSCASCVDALAAVRAEQPIPTISGESAALFANLLACLRETSAATECAAACACDGLTGPALTSCAAICSDCAVDRSVCSGEQAACSSDPPRPIERQDL